MGCIDVEAWEESMIDRELSPNTIANYLTTAKQFVGLYDEFSKRNVVAYKKWLVENGKAVKSINNRIIALNQYAIFKEIPCGVKTIKTQTSHSLENVITLEEKNILTEGLLRDGDMNGWAMVEFLSRTGVRVGELVQMRKQCIADGRQLITNKGKTRNVYVPKSLSDDLAPYYDTRWQQYMFTPISRSLDVPLKRESVGNRLRTYAKRYGVNVKVCHPHSFRHMFAIEFMKQCGNITLLADVLGHSSINTTQIYTRMTEKEQRATMDEVVTW